MTENLLFINAPFVIMSVVIIGKKINSFTQVAAFV
jgi:hypothetical protein